MDDDVDYFRSLAKRIGPILDKYTTSSTFRRHDLEGKDGGYEVEITVRFGTEEDYSVYIEEAVGKRGKKGDDGPIVTGQKITVYVPEDFWRKRGEEMGEELRSKFLTAKGSSIKVVVITPHSGFRLQTLAK